jgi:hypothetical protein
MRGSAAAWGGTAMASWYFGEKHSKNGAKNRDHCASLS